MKITASTPTRIDLAGGTLDIHPLYLFEDGGLTVNLAISLRSWVEVETLAQGGIQIRSLDLEQRLEAPRLEELPQGGTLDLLARTVRFYRPGSGVRVVTRNTAPMGSGLGASSALLMALSGALNALEGSQADLEDLIHWGAALEAQSLGIPTGKQDYYAAIYGGLNALWFDVKGVHLEPLAGDSDFLEELSGRLVLTFTGVSHFSGTNNWHMLKRYIQNQGETREALKKIKHTALAMRDALLARDFRALARALNQEWENRRSLAPGVSTDFIDGLMDAAKGAGALASKICGAGGGGCMVTLVHPGRRARVENALREAGGRILPFVAEAQGLALSQEARLGVEESPHLVPQGARPALGRYY